MEKDEDNGQDLYNLRKSAEKDEREGQQYFSNPEYFVLVPFGSGGFGGSVLWNFQDTAGTWGVSVLCDGVYGAGNRTFRWVFVFGSLSGVGAELSDGRYLCLLCLGAVYDAKEICSVCA